VAGTGQDDSLAIEWGTARLGSTLVDRHGRADFDIDALPATASAVVPWQFVTATQLPDPPKPASVFRVVLATREPSSSVIGVTTPVTYSTHELGPSMDGGTSISLLHPAVVTYFPCASQPRMEGGQVEAPDWVIATKEQGNPLEVGRLSPFAGVVDLYRVERLPLDDSRPAPPDLVAFRVDRQIPGGVELTPLAETTSS
jgi:hypothetical protein